MRASYPLTERLRHGLRTTIRVDEINGVSDDASVFIQEEEGSSLTALIGHTLTYDVLDTQFLPSDGYLIRFDQSVADFGADTRYLRNELLLSYYYPFFPDWVINLAARGGHIHGLGEDVRLFDRFFLGGSTLRGFKFAGVGPRDTSTGDALGGNLLYTGSAELRFPLGLPEELRIFGRTFVDAGTLYDSRRERPDRRGQRRDTDGRRCRAFLAVPARPDLHRLGGALHQEHRGRDGEFSHQLRHPLLMPAF